MSSTRLRLRPRWPVCLCYAALLLLCWTAAAAAIDRYEIQIYSGETAPLHHLTLELHSTLSSLPTGRSPRNNCAPTNSTRPSRSPTA